MHHIRTVDECDRALHRCCRVPFPCGRAAGRTQNTEVHCRKLFPNSEETVYGPPLAQPHNERPPCAPRCQHIHGICQVVGGSQCAVWYGRALRRRDPRVTPSALTYANTATVQRGPQVFSVTIDD